MAQTINREGAAVMASVAEYGISSKEVRGVVEDHGAMPQSLQQVQGVLSRFARKAGLDLSASVRDIAASASAALAKQAQPAASRTPQADNDLTL